MIIMIIMIKQINMIVSRGTEIDLIIFLKYIYPGEWGGRLLYNRRFKITITFLGDIL